MNKCIARHAEAHEKIDDAGEGKAGEQRRPASPSSGRRTRRATGPSRSKIATISTSVVSLNSAMNELTMPGMTSRKRLRQDDRSPSCASSPAPAPSRPRTGRAGSPAGRRAPPPPYRRAANSTTPISTRSSPSISQLSGQEQRQHVGREEQHRDQRHAAPELDEDDAQRADDRQLRAPPERQQNAERQRDNDAGERDHQSHQKSAPEPGLDMRQAEHAADQQEEADDRETRRKTGSR